MSVGRLTLVAMMPLGTRVVPPEVDTLHRRIKAALNEALERQVAGGFYGSPDAARGLAAPDLEELGAHDVIRLSLDDAARIAAAEAFRWF